MTALNEDAERIPLANEQQEVLAHALRLHLPNQGKAKQKAKGRASEKEREMDRRLFVKRMKALHFDLWFCGLVWFHAK